MPESFKHYATQLYAQIGSPVVNSDSFWTVYTQFLAAFRQLQLDHLQEQWQAEHDTAFEGEIKLMEGQQALRLGVPVVGAEQNGIDEEAQFSDESGGEIDTDDEDVDGSPVLRYYAHFSDEE